jgi:glutamate-1-semialdehyde 2,1-aminomutase
VIVEAVAANMGLVAPEGGFLDGLRAACDAAGALLVFDEVITGFRLGEGGASGWAGVRPDLWCFGKVIGGGLPVGAFGGRSDVLESLAPDGPVYQAGTLSGNPLATAAGLAVLESMGPESYRTLCDRVARFGPALAAVLTSALMKAGTEDSSGRQLEAQVPVVGPLFGLFFAPSGSGPVRDYDGAVASASTGVYARLFRSMLDRGVALAPGPYEVAFPSMAHGDAELDRTLDVASEAVVDAVAG